MKQTKSGLKKNYEKTEEKNNHKIKIKKEDEQHRMAGRQQEGEEKIAIAYVIMSLFL